MGEWVSESSYLEIARVLLRAVHPQHHAHCSCAIRVARDVRPVVRRGLRLVARFWLLHASGKRLSVKTARVCEKGV